MSLIAMIIWLAYAALKFEQMMSKHNPFISLMTEENIFDYTTRIDLNEINFRMAFSIEGYLDSEVKDDPRYVKYIVRVYGKKDGVDYQ